MEKVVFQLTHLLVDNNIIREEERAIYSYGIALLLTSGITGGAIISLGIGIHQGGLTLLFLSTLAGLRHYSGGFHAKSYLGCFCISCICYLGMLVVVEKLSNHLGQGVLLGSSWIASGYFIKYGSMNSEKNPKTDREMKRRKRMTRCFSLVYTGIITLACGLIPSLPQGIWVLGYVQMVTVLGMIHEQIKGGNKNEKTIIKGHC